MGPTTEGPGRTAAEEFYDRLAPDYDAMTDFEKRFAAARPHFSALVERHGIRTAVDAGAGTGFHSLVLARMGVDVTAVDLSAAMLSRLEENARALGLPVRILRSSFADLPASMHGSCDAVFCLGNTLAHLLSRAELLGSLRTFRGLLRPGGVLLTQTLNYDRILRSRDRVQSIREAGGDTFIRFYDFEDPLIRFNVLKISRREGRIAHELHAVPLRPVTAGELAGLLGEAGFARVGLYGSVSMEEFQPGASADLVALAEAGSPPA